MSDEITVRLSRADAEHARWWLTNRLVIPPGEMDALTAALNAALAADSAPDAPADVPDRAKPCEAVQAPLAALIAECEAHPDWRWELMQDHPGVYRAAIDGPAFAAVSSRETPVDALRGAIEAMQRAAGEPQGSGA